MDGQGTVAALHGKTALERFAGALRKPHLLDQQIHIGCGKSAAIRLARQVGQMVDLTLDTEPAQQPIGRIDLAVEPDDQRNGGRCFDQPAKPRGLAQACLCLAAQRQAGPQRPCTGQQPCAKNNADKDGGKRSAHILGLGEALARSRAMMGNRHHVARMKKGPVTILATGPRMCIARR